MCRLQRPTARLEGQKTLPGGTHARGRRFRPTRPTARDLSNPQTGPPSPVSQRRAGQTPDKSRSRSQSGGDGKQTPALFRTRLEPWKSRRTGFLAFADRQEQFVESRANIRLPKIKSEVLQEGSAHSFGRKTPLLFHFLQSQDTIGDLAR